jgi:hypothetical protein
VTENIGGLPYGSSDCVAHFVRDIESPPEAQCLHLALDDRQISYREMHLPTVIRCLGCALWDTSPAAVSCNCCGAAGIAKTVTLGVSRSGTRCTASLCSLSVSLIPPPVWNTARGAS